ncbi:hypothetical protein EBU99_08700 [bacterium]|nr:hypothetical protein [bacterium]
MASLLLVCCSQSKNPTAALVPVKISLVFDSSQGPETDQSKALKETLGASSNLASSVDSTTLVSDATRIAIPPIKLLNDPDKNFTFKRSKRWLSYRLSRENEVLKSDSLLIKDRDIFELAPIELEAKAGEQLKAVVSLMQVDFMNESDAANFCKTGAPGYVRTWNSESSYKVGESGEWAVVMNETGRSTLAMSAVKLEQALVQKLKTDDIKIFLTDTLNNRMMDAQLCDPGQLNVHNVPKEDAFGRILAFSKPLKNYQFVLSAAGNLISLLPSDDEEGADEALSDPEAVVSTLNVTQGFRVVKPEVGRWFLSRTHLEKILPLGWNDIEPRVDEFILAGGAEDGFINKQEYDAKKNLVQYKTPDGADAKLLLMTADQACPSEESGYVSAVPLTYDSRIVDGKKLKVCIRVANSSGNFLIAESKAFVVDLTPASAPTISVAALSDTYINLNENNAGFKVQVSGEPGASYSIKCSAGNCNFTPVGDGVVNSGVVTGRFNSAGVAETGVKISSGTSVVFVATQTDIAGNPESLLKELSGNVDLAAPSLVLSDGTLSLMNNVFFTADVSSTFSGTCESGLTVTLLGDVQSGQTSTCAGSSAGSSGGGSFSFSLIKLSAGTGNKKMRARQVDAAGNEGFSSELTVKLSSPPATPTSSSTAIATATPTSSSTATATATPTSSSTPTATPVGTSPLTPTITSPVSLTKLRGVLSGTCDFATGNTTTATTTLGQIIKVECTAASGLAVVIDLPAGPATTFTVDIKTTNATGQSAMLGQSVNRTAFVCPAGYVAVPGYPSSGTSVKLGSGSSSVGNSDPSLDPSKDFCVMKYPAKYNGSGAAVSQPNSLPWVNIPRGSNSTGTTGTPGTPGTTGTPGTPGSAIQKNLEGVRANWSGGIVGSGILNRGHSDGSPAQILDHSPDDLNAYIGTGDAAVAIKPWDQWGSTTPDPGADQKRTHMLSNGEVIWDFSGNIWQWVRDDISTLGVDFTGVTNDLDVSVLTGTNQMIFGTGLTLSSPSTKNLGRFVVPASANAATLSGAAFARGGAFDSNDAAGLYAANLSFNPSIVSDRVGFRCVAAPLGTGTVASGAVSSTSTP